MDMQRLDDSVAILRRAWGRTAPACAIVLGSGWSRAFDAAERDTLAFYADIPCLGVPGAEGHAGQVAAVDVAGRRTLVFFGRRHVYEGLGWEPVVFPAYAALKLGAAVLLLTNSAGGIRADLQPGDLMLITDHINAMGDNPLRGPHKQGLGPRFPDLSVVYDRDLRQQMTQAARRSGISLRQGVYLGTGGPTYETPAEIRAFRAWGADAVGMSTVPEAITGHAAGLRVAGLSCISNRAASPDSALSHTDVVATAERALPRMKAVVHAFTAELPRNPTRS